MSSRRPSTPSCIASRTACSRLGLAGLFRAGLCLALLGCEVQRGADTAEASSADTSALDVAARAFLAKLNGRQRAVASFPFDDAERTAWAYVPQKRGGIPLRAMNTKQRAAAFDVLRTGLSERGVALAHGIIQLEGVLRELEGPLSNLVIRRDPDLYYLAVFVGPGPTDPWGWRFEGHHLSVNVTKLGPHGQIVAPLFMGANPARIPTGPNAGFRLLAAEEDLAFELLHILDPHQRARVTIGAETFGTIVTGTDPTVKPISFAGLAAAEMTIVQQQQLRRLLEVYAGRMADSSAARQLRRIDEVGFQRLHFAWAGSHQPRGPHYYRIHGPTVLVEYDNSQASANHIHTVWRDLENDFGGDMLRRHYARQPHRR